MTEENIKAKFEFAIDKIYQTEKSDRSTLLTREKYQVLLGEVKEAQNLWNASQSLTSKQYRRLRRYDVLRLGEESKLIGKRHNDNNDIKFYVCREQMFDIVHTVHINTGHKREKVMEKELKKKYVNITREIINAYLKNCQLCQMKKKIPKKSLVVKPIISESSQVLLHHTTIIKDEPNIESQEEVAAFTNLEESEAQTPNTFEFNSEGLSTSGESRSQVPTKRTKKRKRDDGERNVQLLSTTSHRPQTVSNSVSNKNEFDIFGESVAAQLKNMPLEDAFELQLEIQQLITRKRLQSRLQISGNNSSSLAFQVPSPDPISTTLKAESVASDFSQDSDGSSSGNVYGYP